MERLINSIYKLRFFSWLIAFFIGGVFYSLTCNAQALPSPTPDTFSTIINGNNSLSFSIFSDIDVLPINPNPVNIYRIIEDVAKDPLVVGAQLNLMQNNDYTVSELTQKEKDTYSQVYPYLYDVNGNTVSWDNVYHLHYMNAMFHGDVYIDSSGNILTSDQDNTKTMFQLGIGGYLLNVNDVANIYNEISNQLANNQMLYSLNPDIDISNNTMNCYVFAGLRGNYNGKIPWYYAQELYLPNIYNRNLYYVSGYGNWNSINLNTPTQIYCVNNPSKYLNTVYNQHGSNYPVYNIQSVNYTYEGVTYNYLLNCPQAYAFRVNSILSSKENFLSDSNLQNQNCVLNYNKFNYDPNLCFSDDDVVAFKVLQPKTGKILQIDDNYSYDDIKQVEENLNNITSSPNELFDPDKAVSEENYPQNNPYNEPAVNPSTLPFPSKNDSPEDVPESNPEENPSIDNPYPDVNPNEINNTIPIISGLQNKFPFSIPWDIYNLIKGLSVPRETPVLNFEITFPVINYTWNPVIDLSMYDSTAELFRTLFLIVFIIGLAVFSYNHFFGS